MGVEIGKMEGSVCYYTALDGPGQNGTSLGPFEVMAVSPTCNITFGEPVGRLRDDGFPNNTVVGGFRGDGVAYGVCLAIGGEGEGSLIPGKVFLGGSRVGQCCWSAGYKQHCVASGYRLATSTGAPAPTPQPAPPVPPEPVPALLEPNGRIFSARLSYSGTPTQMGLTFATPNNTAPSYAPSVWWSAKPGGGNRSAVCTSSPPRSCYTDSPVMHYCNMSGLQPATKYFYRFGDAQVGITPATAAYTFTTPPATGAGPGGKQVVVVYGDMGLDYSEGTRAMLARWAAADAFDWVIHNGDISYADNHISSRTHPGVDPAIYIDWMDTFYANVSA